MFSIQAVTVAAFKILVSLLRLQSVEGELYASCVISLSTVNALDSRITAERI